MVTIVVTMVTIGPSAAQAERAAAEERAAGREHVEELRGRVAARQRWLAEEQAAVDAKIEEATRPAADSMRTHSAAVEALAAEVDALRYPISLNYTSFKQKESKPAKRSYFCSVPIVWQLELSRCSMLYS